MHRPTVFLVLLLAGAATAGAAEKKLPKLNLDAQPTPAYQDLPGVKTPEEMEAARADGFTCTTTLSTHRQDGSEGFDRSLPERVYRCEKNGIVLESRDPPARGVWMPGINPPDAR